MFPQNCPNDRPPASHNMIRYFQLWDNPFTIISTTPKAELAQEDSSWSRRCPIYVEPIKQSHYISFVDEVSFTWLGGRDIEVQYPSWWNTAYESARLAWLQRSGGQLGQDTLVYRHRGNNLFSDTAAAHAGGCVVNVFTGWSIGTPLGVKCLVTEPSNRFTHLAQGMGVQQGLYDTDLFPGDFSFNLQFMMQNRKVTFARGEPVCSLHYHQQPSLDHELVIKGKDLDDRVIEGDSFYIRKALHKQPYAKLIDPKNVHS